MKIKDILLIIILGILIYLFKQINQLQSDLNILNLKYLRDIYLLDEKVNNLILIEKRKVLWESKQ